MSQRSRPAVPDDAAVVENLLKLGGGSATLSGCQVCLSANICVIEAGKTVGERNVPQLDRESSLQGTREQQRVFLSSANCA